MQIPLTPEEVKMLTETSGYLNKVYAGAFNTLGALKGKTEPGNPRPDLLPLRGYKETLQRIREDIATEPLLTEKHMADIHTLQAEIPQVLRNLQASIRSTAVDALDDKVTSDEMVYMISHGDNTVIALLEKTLRKMFKMLEVKTATLGGRRGDSSAQGEVRAPQ